MVPGKGALQRLNVEFRSWPARVWRCGRRSAFTALALLAAVTQFLPEIVDLGLTRDERYL
jgi:hypothetical protein